MSASYGSADGATWDAKPVVAFPQKFYREEIPLLLNLTARPEIKFIRAHWDVAGGDAGRKRPCSNSASRCGKFRRKSSRKPPGACARSRDFKGKRSDCRSEKSRLLLLQSDLRNLTSRLRPPTDLRYIEFMALIPSLMVRTPSSVLRARCVESFAFPGTNPFRTATRCWRRLRRARADSIIFRRRAIAPARLLAWQTGLRMEALARRRGRLRCMAWGRA
jgi:hypothetical protein